MPLRQWSSLRGEVLTSPRRQVGEAAGWDLCTEPLTWYLTVLRSPSVVGSDCPDGLVDQLKEQCDNAPRVTTLDSRSSCVVALPDVAPVIEVDVVV